MDRETRGTQIGTKRRRKRQSYREVQRQIHVSKISPKKAKSYPDSNQFEKRKRDKGDREIKETLR